jgi:hypothetical protein
MQSMDAHRTDTGELRREMQVGFPRIDGRLDTMQGQLPQ